MTTVRHPRHSELARIAGLATSMLTEANQALERIQGQEAEVIALIRLELGYDESEAGEDLWEAFLYESSEGPEWEARLAAAGIFLGEDG